MKWYPYLLREKVLAWFGAQLLHVAIIHDAHIFRNVSRYLHPGVLPSSHSFHRDAAYVGVADLPGQVAECILKTVKEVNNVMVKPEPELIVSGIAGTFGNTTGIVSGYTGEIVTLTLHFWIAKGQKSIITDAMLALRAALPKSDIAIREPVEM